MLESIVFISRIAPFILPFFSILLVVESHQNQQPYMAQQPVMGVPQQVVQQQVPQSYGQNQHQYAPAYQQQVPQQGVQANQNLIRDKAHIQDREHIKEHLQGVVDHPDVAKMSEEELQFHYFKMHDNDDNNKLDGCELIKSLIHWHVEESKHLETAQGQGHAHGHPPPAAGHQDGGIPQQPGGNATPGIGTTKIFTEQELTMMIDPILDMDDRNKDGFIDYPEFVAAQQSRGF